MENRYGTVSGNFGQILSRFTWELPQTLLGYNASGYHNLFGGMISVTNYGVATAVESYSRSWGGFTLGSFVVGDRGLQADPTNSLFQHKFGHYLQSQAFGIFYLPKFAVPSLIDAAGDGNHKLYFTEQDANSRAFTYFNEHIKNYNKNGTDWKRFNNPIDGYDWSKPYDDLSNQKALSKNISHFKFYDFALVLPPSLFNQNQDLKD